MNAALFGSTGAAEMSTFHQLSSGNSGSGRGARRCDGLREERKRDQHAGEAKSQVSKSQRGCEHDL